MKKISLIIMLLMAFAMVATAQNKKMKIAVMDFKAGVGVNANEVEGLSDMLINTLFETKKFDIVERSQLYEVLKEQKLQGELTVQQCVQVGRILGVESVLIGTVNFLAEHKNLDGSITGEYNVDIRAVDVESGQILTTAGAAKSSSSTYRALMERIARQLAENLMDEKPEVVVFKELLTKEKDFYGKKYYALGGRRLTNEEYLETLRNCPEAWYYNEKGLKQIKTGNILMITAGAIAVTGLASALIPNIPSAYILAAGIPVVLTSIPFYITGSKKKNNAYKVYNQYCAKPTAKLSFGPATNSIGTGIYLNF
jgi:hypothetical protein